MSAPQSVQQDRRDLPSPGSSPLTPAQQDWYLERYGVRYLAVQEQPLRPSRRVRRGRVTRQDMQTLDAQQHAVGQLRGTRIIKAH